MLKGFKLLAAAIICGIFLNLSGNSNGATFIEGISSITTSSLTTMPSSVTQTAKNTLRNFSSQITAQVKQVAVSYMDSPISTIQNAEVSIPDIMLGVLSREITLSLEDDFSPEQYFVDPGNSLSMFSLDFQTAADLAFSGEETGILTVSGQYGEQLRDTGYIGIIGLAGEDDSLDALNDYSPGLDSGRLSALKSVGGIVLNGFFGELRVLAGKVELSGTQEGSTAVSGRKRADAEDVRREGLYFCVVPLRSLLSGIIEQAGADADKKYMVAIPAERLGPAAVDKEIKEAVSANSSRFYILEITGEGIRQIVDGIISSCGQAEEDEPAVSGDNSGEEETLYRYAFESPEKDPVASREDNEDGSPQTEQSNSDNAKTEEDVVYEYDPSGTEVVTDNSLYGDETDGSLVSAGESGQSTENITQVEQDITVTTESLTLDRLVSILSGGTDESSSGSGSSGSGGSEDGQTSVSEVSGEELYFLTDTTTEGYTSDALTELIEEDNSLDLPSSLVENREIDEINEDADLGGVESASLLFVSDYTEPLTSASDMLNSTVQYSVYSSLVTDIYEMGDFFATEIDSLSDVWIYSLDVFTYDYIFSQVSVGESTGMTMEYKDDILSAFSKIARSGEKEQGYLDSREEEGEEGYPALSGYRERVEPSLTKLLVNNTGEDDYYVTEQERQLASYSPADEKEDDDKLALTGKKSDDSEGGSPDEGEEETTESAVDSEDKDKLDRGTSTKEGMKYYREKIKENLEKLPDSEKYIAMELSSY